MTNKTKTGREEDDKQNRTKGKERRRGQMNNHEWQTCDSDNKT